MNSSAYDIASWTQHYNGRALGPYDSFSPLTTILPFFALFMLIPLAFHVVTVLINFALVTYVGVPPWLVWNPEFVSMPLYMDTRPYGPPYYYHRNSANKPMDDKNNADLAAVVTDAIDPRRKDLF